MAEQSVPLTARKLTGWIQFPTELLESALSVSLIGVKPLTEQEREELRQKRAREAAAALSEWEAMRARYAGVPAVLAVLDIHKPDGSDRLECELSEDNELPTHWPCSTFEAIRDAVTP